MSTLFALRYGFLAVLVIAVAGLWWSAAADRPARPRR
jgi:hypothetical protein